MAESKKLHVTVITPARAVLDTDAQSVVVPAFDGEMGVLPGHAAMLALLGTGVARVTALDGNTRQFAIRGGFLQIERDRVTVLTPESASAEELRPDVLQAEAAKLENEKPTKLDERDALATRQAWVKARRRLAAEKR